MARRMLCVSAATCICTVIVYDGYLRGISDMTPLPEADSYIQLPSPYRCVQCFQPFKEEEFYEVLVNTSL